MKIAFISATYPEDESKFVLGVHKRVSMFVEAISHFGELEMLYYVDSHIPISREYIDGVERKLHKHWGINLKLNLCHLAPKRFKNNEVQYYLSPIFSIHNHLPFYRLGQPHQVAAYEELLSRNPDMIFAHRLGAMCVINRSRRQSPPIYFDLDDIEHIAFLRNLRQPPIWISKRLLYLHVASMLLAERKSIKRSQRTFVCSELDRLKLARALKLDNISAIPNAVVMRQAPPPATVPTLLFLGTFGYRPNIVGANFLISEVWPKVMAAVPGAKLLIAGEHPEQIPAFQSKPPQVEFLGFVEDLDSLYGNSRVVCCPILSGGGTRIKILEAAAYGRPVVSTRIGAEGLNFSDGKDILLRDTPDSFADGCIELLKDPDKAKNISTTAYQLVHKQYNRSAIVMRIEKELSLDK
jgi:glycosyltransferase involved in cell wall biosynthesis